MSWTSLLSLRRGGLAAALIAFSPAVAASQSAPQLAPNAPTDSPVQAAQRCIWVAMDRAMQPYITRARATWPQARQRYLAGLPPRHSFFVTALLVDNQDRREQVFVAVESIRDGRINGKIWNLVEVVRGFHLGDLYWFPESHLRDWLIAK